MRHPRRPTGAARARPCPRCCCCPHRQSAPPARRASCGHVRPEPAAPHPSASPTRRWCRRRRCRWCRRSNAAPTAAPSRASRWRRPGASASRLRPGCRRTLEIQLLQTKDRAAMLRARADPRQVSRERRSQGGSVPVHCPPSTVTSDAMKQHLAVSAIGSDRTGMVHELTRVITECGGSIAESRMAALGSEFAMLLLVSGNWHALARIESELARMAETDALSVHLKRTEPKPTRVDMLPYSVDIVSLDQTGIVAGLSGFFASRSIDIIEVSTRSYPAAHTGAPMLAVEMIVNVPGKQQVAQLREEFMDFCD